MQDCENFDGVASTDVNTTFAATRIRSLRLKSDVASAKASLRLLKGDV
jgi:hypothetical protein